MISIDFINTYLLSIVVFSLVLNFALSIYGIFYRPHYIKKIIALTILSDTANTFAEATLTQDPLSYRPLR
jgi:multicomponent Na+:H+ antiporter subunit C